MATSLCALALWNMFRKPSEHAKVAFCSLVAIVVFLTKVFLDNYNHFTLVFPPANDCHALKVIVIYIIAVTYIYFLRSFTDTHTHILTHTHFNIFSSFCSNDMFSPLNLNFLLYLYLFIYAGILTLLS